MKHVFILTMLLVAVSVRAQITPEHQYPNAVSAVSLVEVDSADWRYIAFTSTATGDTINVYTLSHVLETTIAVPLSFPMPGMTNAPYLKLEYFSRHLFNLDNEYEYMVYSGSEQQPATYVFNELGNTVFSCDSCYPNTSQWIGTRTNGWDDLHAITTTADGTKMMVDFLTQPQRYVQIYSLPGRLASAMNPTSTRSSVTAATIGIVGSATATRTLQRTPFALNTHCRTISAPPISS